jgi:mRNA interferase RelE/StbE
MGYDISYSRGAEKFLDSRSSTERLRLFIAISKLPNCPNVKKMKGYDVRYRLKVGSFRIIYDLFDNELKIYIIKIGNRGDVYNK